MRKIIYWLAAVFIGVTGATFESLPASASLSQCDQAYICAWTNSSYSGNFMEWDPGAVYYLSGHCANFNSTYMQDAISSIKSNNGAPNFYSVWYKDINCTGGGKVLTGTSGISNLAGSGYNDTFSSVLVEVCC